MVITYAIWHGSFLLNASNMAVSMKQLDKVINELNASDTAKKTKYHASIINIVIL